VKLSLFSCVGKEVVFLMVEEESNSIHKINRKTFILIGHISLGNCLMEHNIE
jgi:hypothetical protein